MIPSQTRSVVTLASLSQRNGTNVAGVDISPYTGSFIVAVEVQNNAANAATVDFAIQTSADNSTGWTNVTTNSNFTQVTDATAARGTLCEFRTLDELQCQRYVRLAVTATGNPAVTCGAQLLVVPRNG